MGIAAATSPSAAIAQERSAPSADVRYKTVTVDGINIFYREAGDPAKPTILLLHGFPASSHEFRTLIPLLSSRFHLVAPDYPGFGFSDAPSEARFAPTFANLTNVMDRFVQAVGLTRFTIYMQDFGGPVGFRLAMAHPDMVDGLIIQNANAYEVGIAPDVLKDMRTRAGGPLNAKASAALEGMLSPGGTKFQYLTGVRDLANVDPTSYRLDSFVQALPQQHRIQRALIVDYYDNVRQYPAWHAYLKARQPKTLILWGKNDPIFLPAGADAYSADLPKAEVHLLNTGHFALEEDAEVAAKHILRTFGE
ncbi:alpha/beta fold hydrolase [Sphingomonas sp. CROZ-RG-20F-R02-07]|uniref:alpha/beta fold hydrolase n=1 Tax=Sphingomonas sp. CROZ-RG-20F-R02-07 TaxID=2914832 RepID=UPI001F587816|nr:alpha/beta fold hydrolase [Sphingomonas sp. CROZ-RG-20F-R02-07]